MSSGAPRSSPSSPWSRTRRLGLSGPRLAADQRRRILEGATSAFAREGYGAVSIRQIIEPVSVSRKTFYELFGGKAEVYLEAHAAALAELTIHVAEAGRHGDWVEGAATGIAEALAFAAGAPERATLLVAPAGSWAAHLEAQLVTRFSPSLRLGRRLTATAKPRTLEAAVIGGIVGVVARRLAIGRAEELPALAPELAEFALVPYIGQKAAREAARQGGRG